MHAASAESFCGKTVSLNSTPAAQCKHIYRQCAKQNHNPSTTPTQAVHADVVGAVFPVEATLLSWMSNTSTLEVFETVTINVKSNVTKNNRTVNSI